MFSPTITTFLETAAAKALASTGTDGVNVISVSMIKVNTDSIWLFDFFMDKTAKNIQADPAVALSAWTAMTGVQIKADVTYITEGPEFDDAVIWAKNNNPKRVVKGLLTLKPKAIFDISPGGVFTTEDLQF